MGLEEAQLIANTLAQHNPGKAFVVVGVKESEESDQIKRYAVTSEDLNLRLDFAWQFVIMVVEQCSTRSANRAQILAPMSGGKVLPIR